MPHTIASETQTQPHPERATRRSAAVQPTERPVVCGPFLFCGEDKLSIKGASYGTFAADENGDLFPPRERVQRDFRLMRRANINTIRTYTPPPDWLLEEARQAGLRVIVGIYWEGLNCRFDDPVLIKEATTTVKREVARLKRYPDVVLAYCIGNEIPPLVARFHGRDSIERFIRRLYETAKEEDPEGLVTYGNYPSTEFLQLEFLDFYTINVYLLEKEKLAAYLDRILIEAKGKPLLLGEAGDDSLRRGEAWQAELLDWTIPLAFNKGLLGIIVFSWTDDWVVGGQRVEDWAFGLVDPDGEPKLAYDVVKRRFGERPFAWRDTPWPRVSVVVCNYNGSETLDETLRSLQQLDYPDYEIVFVDDGSTDRSLEIARVHEDRVKIIAQENQGLSVARNVGALAASGDIVAYIDSDAFADPDWLRFLVLSMEFGDFSGVGGPNLTPASDGLTAQFIALCPGNPTCVLKDNRHAEHVAGVNMAFRRDLLLGLGGFDPVHTKAGDDVDICWRFEDANLPIAFSPTAIVWHHRRPSIRRFLKQQLGYGVAENQLEKKHPERFNLGGYIRWAGRVYLAPRRISRFSRPFIYHGRLGTGLFQTLYEKEPSYLSEAPRMVQWYLLAALMLALSPLSPWLLPVALGLLSMSLFAAVVPGFNTVVGVRLTGRQKIQKVWTISLLYFLHPLVRWYGRFSARLRHANPLNWRLRWNWTKPRRVFAELRFLFGKRKEMRRYWGVGSFDREKILREIRQSLKARKVAAGFSQDWDSHDLFLNGTVTAEGRFFTAPEHYDQALCCGFKAHTTGLVRFFIASTTAAVFGASLFVDLRFLPLLAVPLVTLWYTLGQRNRLRSVIWETVEAVMEKREARRYELAGNPKATVS